jgi:multiphosphoryl transfer protein
MNSCIQFPFPLSAGLHARPASLLRDHARIGGVQFELTNARNGRKASLADLLSLLATDTRQGDPCRIEASGDGAAQALEGLQAYLGGAFLQCDPSPDDSPSDPSPECSTVVHRLLVRHGATWWQGTPVSPGIGRAPLRFLGPAVREARDVAPAGTPDQECRALDAALRRVGTDLDAEILGAAHETQRAILGAHRAMLQDAAWISAMRNAILAGGSSAFSAVAVAGREAARTLLQSESHYLRERAQDLEDLVQRVQEELSEGGGRGAVPVLESPAILVAEDLLPSRFLALDRRHLHGLVLTGGGRTSHTAILARSFGIPCVANLPSLRSGTRTGQDAILDGRRGLVITGAPAPVQAYYDLEVSGMEARARRLSELAAADSGTRAGHGFEVRANISTPEEAALAVERGADGIGLFRTEMVFLQRTSAPSEDEQFEAYAQALDGARGRPLVLRLLDTGGDKPLPYLALPKEANPFLGLRAVRWYPAHEALIRTQIRAALRASIHGDLRLLVPMVSDVEEIRWVRGLVREVAAGLPGDPEVPVGIMVEVPSAALHAAALARESDFFCVGTNDLVQYLFASDRTDPRVAKESQGWHPATLRCLRAILQGARETGIPVSLCGELGANPRILPLLAGLGFGELSVAIAAVPEIKAAAARLDGARCRDLVEAALGDATTAEVDQRLRTTPVQEASASILEPGLVVLDAACATKEEAIKLLVERLHAEGRALDPLRLEEAVWSREAAYATAIGFEFAVPHCQSDSVSDSSMAILRLAEPVDWNPEEPTPVRCVILLAMGGGDGGDLHLRVFARLARRLMDPTFRDSILHASDPEALVAQVRAEIAIVGSLSPSLPQEPSCLPS